MPCGQSYKCSTIVIYNSRDVTGNFLVSYESRFVIYERRAFATGLVVTKGDSCLSVCGFKSKHRMETFFTLICCKNCIVCLKRPKITKNEAGDERAIQCNLVS